MDACKFIIYVTMRVLGFSFKSNLRVTHFTVHVFCSIFEKRRTELSPLPEFSFYVFINGTGVLCNGKGLLILLVKTIHPAFGRN